ncbi:MAG: protein-glutamate O-methyltransferase CheR [Ignavibacteriaceae bacterium]|nr:protein-glutamate O-methyltransferase CheR [Ignavibacteriaceae bacterium]
MTQYSTITSTQPAVTQHKNVNELALSSVAFENFRKMIYDSCGIYFQDNKKYLLESRLLKRINYLGMDSYEEYYDYLKYNSSNIQEKKYLYEAITINETFFFRNQPQLDALVTTVIPQLIASKPGKPRIKIWSAASSSGEEAYSTAIIIFDLLRPKYPDLEIEIVGTDINNAVIETAKTGIYREYSIRNTQPYYLKKYFKPVGNAFEIDPAIKKVVSFKNFNLFDDISMRSMTNFDIIFCANVLIYFDAKAKIKVVSNLYNSLNKGGYLFIGYAETLHTISKAFTIVSFPKTIGYKKE